MLVKNSKFKDAPSQVVCGFYELADVGRMHPMRECSMRSLQRSLDSPASRRAHRVDRRNLFVIPR